MNIHALVEGPSERAFLELWARRLLQGHSIKVYPHQGKGALPADPFASPDPKNRALLHQLPSKLRAFADSLNPETDRVVVIVDADGDDCVALTREIVRAIDQFAPRLLVAVRIAIEETEAFYLGDQHALRGPFPTPTWSSCATMNPILSVGLGSCLAASLGTAEVTRLRGPRPWDAD